MRLYDILELYYFQDMIMLQNAKKVLFQKFFFVYFSLGAFLIAAPTLYFLDVELVTGNIGSWFVYAEIILTVISAVLFGFFLASVMYKVKYFSLKWGAEWAIGWAFVMIVSGCPSCSITLAYYIGLAGLISSLPYHGLELKFLWIWLISYAIYDQLKYLETCKLKKPKKVSV